MNCYNLYFVPFSTFISPFYVLITFLVSLFFVYKIKPKDPFMSPAMAALFSFISKNLIKSSFSFISVISSIIFYIYTYIHTNYIIYKQVKYLYQISKIIKNKISIISKLIKIYEEEFVNFILLKFI